MPLARDASSPAVKLSAFLGTQTASLASNSFSPPAGSIIVVTCWAGDSFQNDWDVAKPTISNSGTALTWNLISSQFNNGLSNKSIRTTSWWAFTSAAPGSMTATVAEGTQAGQTLTFMAVAVDVWTGAKTTGPIGATAFSNSTTGNTRTVAITPTTLGSALVMAAGNWNDATTVSITAGTGCFLLDDANQGVCALAAGEVWLGSGSSTPTLTTVLTSVNLIATESASAVAWSVVAYEVLPGDVQQGVQAQQRPRRRRSQQQTVPPPAIAAATAAPLAVVQAPAQAPPGQVAGARPQVITGPPGEQIQVVLHAPKISPLPAPAQPQPQVIIVPATSSAIPEGDVGAEAEAVTIAADVPEADAAGAVEAISVVQVNSLPVVIQPPLVNPLPPGKPPQPQVIIVPAISVAVSEADAGAETDAVAVAAAVPEADVGAAAEAVSVTQLNSLPVVIQPPQVNPLPAPPQPQPQVLLAPPGVASISDTDAGAEVEAVAISAALPLADVGAAADAVTVAQVNSLPVVLLPPLLVPLRPVAAPPQVIIAPPASIAVQEADAGAGIEAEGVSAAVPLADVAAGLESISGGISASLGASDAAGVTEALSAAASVPLQDLAGATEALAASVSTTAAETAAALDTLAVFVVGVGNTGTVKWTARAYRARWRAEPVRARWAAGQARARWRADPVLARWRTAPSRPRWRARMASFDSISALSLEEVNVHWDSRLDGTIIDPTTTPLVVQMAFPASSGDVAHPTPPAVWYAAGWLAGGTGDGFIAQCLVGPGGGQLTLSAGKYDVHSKISGSPEVPVKFAGVLTVY